MQQERLSYGAAIAIHLALSVLDLAISAASGVAAAATGAHVEGAPITALVLRTGAWAAMLKSGILNSAILVSMTADNVFVTVIVVILGSSFGAAELVTLAVSQRILGQSISQLFIAAAAAAAPMTAGTAIVQATGGVPSVVAAGWDALSGYTFARVAQNHGFHVCQYKSAAAAGGVYGVLTWFIRLPLSIFLSNRAKRQQAMNNNSWTY